MSGQQLKQHEGSEQGGRRVGTKKADTLWQLINFIYERLHAHYSMIFDW